MNALADLRAICWVKGSTCVACRPCTLPGAISAASQGLLCEAETDVITTLFPTVIQTHGVLPVTPLSSRAQGTCRCRLALRHTEAPADSPFPAGR